MKNKWILAPKISDDFKNQFPEINPIILQLLYNRGLTTQKQIDEFLMPDYSQDLHDPFLFSDMDKVIERINRAIQNKEKILIYGDYDADGITASAILKLTLEKLGAVAIDVYLPDREKEGYGIKKEIIEKFTKENIKLIITCDCGITANQEIELANQLGMQVIVTDHHLPLTNLPPAYAIINQHCEEKYPFKYLAGVGVAFKVVQALFKKISIINNQLSNLEAFEKWLLDLVAIGTVADNMPILGENRTLIKYGLIVLNKTKRIGLRALIKEAAIELGDLDTWNIYYQIAPRINAASRMDHANTALSLILTNSQSEAQKIAQELNRLNNQRQKLVEDIFQQLKNSFGSEPKEKILIAQGEKWPVGILGLIANKLTDEYNRPSLVLTIRENDIIGSGRSIEDFNLVELFASVNHFLSRFGGHSKAAGLALEDKNQISNFVSALQKVAEEKLRNFDFSKKIFIEVEIDLKDINWELEEALEKFEPFGEGNRQPLFLIRNLKIENLEWVGQNSQHLKMVANGRKFIIFCANGKCDNLRLGDKVDVVIEIGVNLWNGVKEIQMKVIDINFAK
ncbi:MAG: single-stranded-DNA-specific exonuclease RecJ [Patescibacteria group bacterium]